MVTVGKGTDESLLGQVKEMAGLVDYQAAAVVSRTVLDKHAGTVTLFAFDDGEGLSEHTAPYDALVCVLDGSVEVSIAGEPHVVAAGDMIVMPAGKPHALRALSRFKMMLVMIRSQA
jgi:quercetin dioxygenase-like cupin family protein